MKNMFILSFILSLLSSSVCGQTAKEQMPLIGGDRSVTFKYRNSEEKNVIVEGSFTEAKNMALIDRTWILHVDSLPSEMYTYSFYDGKKKFLDPCNPNVVRDITDTLNYFIVDGFPGSYYKKQNVPHGKVRQLWYPSSFNENMKQRRLSVYLPADYDVNLKKTYPVLYLLHGTGGDEMAWLDMGRLSQIMDNMIAQGKAKPMIVIMPNGIVDLDAAPGQSPYMQGKASRSNVSSWMGRTEKAFSEEIIPFVEKTFRVESDKQHRAIAGLSMGGLHTIAISANNPTMFDYVGLFSPQSINPLTDKNIMHIQKVNAQVEKIKDKLPDWLKQKYEKGKDVVEDVDVYQNLDNKLKNQFKTPPQLYYIAIGRKDPLKTFLDKFRKRLSKQGATYLYNETDGAHSWENWRKYLLDFLPRIFNY